MFAYIKEQRQAKRYPTRPVITAQFMTCGDTISEARVKRALDMLEFMGHMGEKIKKTPNPDETIKDQAYVITDLEGRES